MSQDYDLGVIGGGNMAEAIVGGAVRNGLIPPERIVVCEPRSDRRAKLSTALSVRCTDDNAVGGACLRVLLAVKPQVMGEVVAMLPDVLGFDALVVSIAAGLPTQYFEERLGGRGHIVRVMPNTPMLVGAGASAVSAGPRATREDVAWVRGLLAGAGGMVLEVPEEQMDAVTAVSGSGPAYAFYLIEAMVAAGAAEGLGLDDARRLAIQTLAGAARLLQETPEDPAELRRRVTSPGGTTQRAIETLDNAGVKDALVRAVRAAAQRSRELGEKNP